MKCKIKMDSHIEQTHKRRNTVKRTYIKKDDLKLKITQMAELPYLILYKESTSRFY